MALQLYKSIVNDKGFYVLYVEGPKMVLAPECRPN